VSGGGGNIGLANGVPDAGRRSRQGHIGIGLRAFADSTASSLVASAQI
jgi:hypothetical protein